MKYEEIIKLLDAGYSREEILEMDKPAPEPDPAPAPEPDPAPTDTPTLDMSAMMDEMKTMFSDLTKELMAANIMHSRRAGEDDTDEEIIAKIINPQIDKNGGN